MVSSPALLYVLKKQISRFMRSLLFHRYKNDFQCIQKIQIIKAAGGLIDGALSFELTPETMKNTNVRHLNQLKELDPKFIKAATVALPSLSARIVNFKSCTNLVANDSTVFVFEIIL